MHYVNDQVDNSTVALHNFRDLKVQMSACYNYLLCMGAGQQDAAAGVTGREVSPE